MKYEYFLFMSTINKGINSRLKFLKQLIKEEKTLINLIIYKNESIFFNKIYT